jgi:hypothetical protein
VNIATDRARGLDRRDAEERGYTSSAQKIIGEAKTADAIKALQKGWWNNKDLMDAAHKFWAGNQTSQAATTFGRDFLNQLETTKRSADWYFEIDSVTKRPRNIAMARYFASSAAQGLGISPLEGLAGPPDINRRAAVANAWAPHVEKLGNDYLKFQGAMRAKNRLEQGQRIGTLLPAQMNQLRQDVRRYYTELETELKGNTDAAVRTLWLRVENTIRPSPGAGGGQTRQQNPSPRQTPLSGGRPSTLGEGALSDAIDDLFGVGRQPRRRGRRRT